MPRDASACWWRPCGVALDAAPKPSRHQSRGEGAPHGRLRQVMDSDRSGALSADEFSAAVKKLVRHAH